MKTNLVKYSKGVIILAMLALQINALAQKDIIWKGGTPGMENEWHCPNNWSTSSVPDEFSNVIIPDVSSSTFALPVIRKGSVEVNSIFIHSQASLTIAAHAALMVYESAVGDFEKNLNGEGEIVFQQEGTVEVKKMLASKGL